MKMVRIKHEFRKAFVVETWRHLEFYILMLDVLLLKVHSNRKLRKKRKPKKSHFDGKIKQHDVDANNKPNVFHHLSPDKWITSVSTDTKIEISGGNWKGIIVLFKGDDLVVKVDEPDFFLEVDPNIFRCGSFIQEMFIEQCSVNRVDTLKVRKTTWYSIRKNSTVDLPEKDSLPVHLCHTIGCRVYRPYDESCALSWEWRFA